MPKMVWLKRMKKWMILHGGTRCLMLLILLSQTQVKPKVLEERMFRTLVRLQIRREPQTRRLTKRRNPRRRRRRREVKPTGRLSLAWHDPKFHWTNLIQNFHECSGSSLVGAWEHGWREEGEVRLRSLSCHLKSHDLIPSGLENVSWQAIPWIPWGRPQRWFRDVDAFPAEGGPKGDRQGDLGGDSWLRYSQISGTSREQILGTPLVDPETGKGYSQTVISYGKPPDLTKSAWKPPISMKTLQKINPLGGMIAIFDPFWGLWRQNDQTWSETDIYMFVHVSCWDFNCRVNLEAARCGRQVFLHYTGSEALVSVAALTRFNTCKKEMTFKKLSNL